MVHASNNTQQETTSTETTSETEGTPVSGNEKIIPVSTQEPYEEEISLDFSDENNEDENKSEIPNAEPALPPVSEEEDALETTPIPKTGNTLFDKFLSLTDTARAIFALSEDKSSFKIIGNKTETTLIEYFVYLIEDEIDHLDLFIKKVETQGDEEDEHLLQWSYDTAKQRLDILVDEMLLYQFNQKNTEANGVFDKLNKF
ncbi:MAG: hypothetical protein LBU27_08570 [Candidatus Peribacteria bacterium]|jgi:hypothetical protein|nr:hypothetical protein [Candidatus Peribacteria bacterium]